MLLPQRRQSQPISRSPTGAKPEPEPQPDVNEKYLEASYTPNCFMVKPGESVDIPVLKAYAIWDLYAEWLGKSDFTGMTPEPVLLAGCPRTDHQRRTDPGQTAEDGSIVVSTADKVGNALNRPPHRWRNTLELAYLGDTLRSECGTGGLRKDLHMGQQRRRGNGLYLHGP